MSYRSLSRFRLPVLIAWWVSIIGWVGVAVDNYLVHIPYSLGRECIPCYNYIYYVYNYGYSVGSPGVVGAAFFVAAVVFLLLLWVPTKGLGATLLRVLLIVAPALVFVYEVGVYFFLSYSWNEHATNFLEGTVFTNYVVFVGSGALLPVGLAAEFLRRRLRRRP